MSTHGHFIQLQNQTSSLNTIKAGITTLNGHNDEVETKLDSVITNGTSTNTKLDTFSGHINNTTAIGDGSTQLRVLPLGYNQSGGQARSLLCDAAGHQQIDVVSSALPSGGSTEAKQDVMETTLTAIETDIAALEVLQTATNTKLDTVATNTANIKISTDSVNLNVDTLETLQTSTNTKLDTLETSNQAIKTAVEIIDNAISGSEMQVDIVSSALPSGGATEAKQDVLEATLTAIETDQAAIEVLHTATNSKLDTIDSVLDNILVDTSAIKVDAAALEVLQTSTNSKLDTLETTLTAIETDAAALEVLQTATNTKLDTLETTLTAIETDQAALEVLHTATNSKIDTLDAVVDAAEVHLGSIETNQTNGNQQVKIKGVYNSSLPTVSDGAFEFLQADVNGRLEVRTHSDDVGVATTISTADSTAIPITGVLVHDDDNNTIRSLKCDSSGRLRTVQEGALPAGTNAIGKLAANSGVDIGDVDVTSIAAGTNRIGMVALKANENVAGSGTERHLLCDSAGHLQVDVVSAPSTAVTGTVTANLSATDNAVLDDIAQKAGDIETSVQLIDDVVKAEDAAHSSGDKGIMALAVRQSTQADFGADGDYVPLSINDDGQLRVTTANGSGMVLTTVDSSLAIGSAATDTSAAVEIKSTGPINILVQSGVLGSSFVLALEASMDGSTFHAFNSSYLTQNNSGNSIQAFIDPSAFRPKFIKLKVTNNDVGSQNFDTFVFQ